MAIVGSYRINFTDPKKDSFIIEPYITNGSITPISPTLDARASTASTSLLLYGQYVPNYGERFQENLVHLLENFAGPTPPRNPIEGQLWYDTGDSFTIVGTEENKVFLDGNHSSKIGHYITSHSILCIWYGPKSPTDNTYEYLEVRAVECNVNEAAPEHPQGTTEVCIQTIQGGDVIPPPNAVGNELTYEVSSTPGRLRMAKVVGDDVTWNDVVNVVVSQNPPDPLNAKIGDLWLDDKDPLLESQQLKVFRRRPGSSVPDPEWISVTENYLPLQGGTITERLTVNGQGLFVNDFTLTTSSNRVPNSRWVKSNIAELKDQHDRRMNGIDTEINQINNVKLPDKVSKSGDVVTGPLVFSINPNDTTALVRGIDMKNNSIVNVSNVWDNTDYVFPVGNNTRNVIDKLYVARALEQHIKDEGHNAAGYVERQVSGLGLIPDTIYFTKSDTKLAWETNSTSYSIIQTGRALVMSTGSDQTDVLELRHGQQAVGFTEPGFRLTYNNAQLYNTLYILDGQPQPDAAGVKNDLNDDTAAATKGFVRQTIDDRTSGILPVQGGTFDKDTMVFSLTRGANPPVDVQMFHEHNSMTITTNYTSPPNPGTEVDPVREELEGRGYDTLMPVPISDMLDALNAKKAPLERALYRDLPRAGESAVILDVDSDINGIEISTGLPSSMSIGSTLNIEMFDGDDFIYPKYTIVGFDEVEIIDPDDPTDIEIVDYIIVEPNLPAFDPDTNIWNVFYGDVAQGDDVRELITQSALDAVVYEINQEIVATEQEIATLKSRVTTAENTLANTNTTVTNINGRLSTVENTVSNLPPRTTLIADGANNSIGGNITLKVGAGLKIEQVGNEIIISLDP